MVLFLSAMDFLVGSFVHTDWGKSEPCIIMSPHRRRVGHIVFDAEPVGVGISIGICVTVLCLPDIFYTSKQILIKFA